ncbi:SU10 major capsid protein [Kluyvera sp. CHPC 1.2972]|uniref:SU10 major capsid protein n=1 Tax=Kluyvera sp. CHPC 1.2972 TaxID=2995176 RepID=UPI002FD86BA2
MAALTLWSYDHVGVKSEVANDIAMLDPEQTMFWSTIGKKKVDNQHHRWQIDSLKAPGSNAYPENVQWADVPKSYGKTTMLENYTQKLILGLAVTSEAQRQSYYAGTGQLDRQSKKRATELKADFEWAMFNNGPAVAPADGSDGNPVAATAAGIKYLISSTDGGTTISGDPLKGIQTYIVSESATPTEDDIKDALKRLKTVGAKPKILMASMDMSDTISGMQEKTGENGNRVRVFENSTEVSWEVSTLTDAFGQTVMVMFNPMMPNGTVLIYNPEDWQEAVFGEPRVKDLPELGDADEVAFLLESGWEHANPWRSAWIEGKPAS